MERRVGNPAPWGAGGTARRGASAAPGRFVPLLGLALWLSLLAGSHSAEAAAPDSAEDGSPAACARVDYGTAAARESGNDGASTAVAPPNPNGPTIVGVGFHVNDIRGIDPVNNEFEFRGYIRVLWCDPRLAFDARAEGRSERVLMGDAAKSALERIWFPAGYPVNGVGETSATERVMRVRHDGTVESSVNVRVLLASEFDLRRFPLDKQTLELQVESFLWDSSHLQFVHDESISGFSEETSIPEWTIESVAGKVREVSAIKSDTPFERYVLEIEIARKPGFYIWKVFLPLVLIVALSWSVFWMTDERFSNRSRISATGVLTVVAYQFAFAKDLPRIGYLTLFDQVMIGSFVLLAVTVLESLLVDRANATDVSKALQIDRTSRWLFPTVYLGMLIAIGLSAG